MVILINPDSLRDKLQKCTDAFVSHLDAALVRIWTVDDRELMLKLIGLGVDGIISNRPALLLEVMAEEM